MNIDYILMAQGNADKINPNSNPNDWSSLFASLGQLFFLVVVVVFVLILTVYTTKLIARVKLATNKNGNLQII